MISLYYKNPDNIFLDSLKKGTTNAIAYVQTGAKKVFAPVYNGWVYLIELSYAKQDNVELKEQLSGLKNRLNDLQVIQEENVRLRKLARLPFRKKYKTILATMVGTSSNDLEASIIIDKGTNDGIRNHLPVFSKDGLVGQVINASTFASQIQLIVDSKSGVAAEIVSRGAKGLVQGTYDRDLEMILVKKTVTVKAGDAVITSGLGGVYPAGLFIGRVSSVKNPPQFLYKEINIKSEVDFDNLHEILVIKSPLPPNIEQFER